MKLDQQSRERKTLTRMVCKYSLGLQIQPRECILKEISTVNPNERDVTDTRWGRGQRDGDNEREETERTILGVSINFQQYSQKKHRRDNSEAVIKS